MTQTSDQPPRDGQVVGVTDHNGDTQVQAGTIRVRYNIQKMVSTLIVLAVLLPAARYSIGLAAPKPAELIVAISIAVFSSLLCLFLLDITGVFPFRSRWVSRSVYAAAVVSILGTSVGVYQGAFSERKYPWEGAWNVRVSNPDGTLLADRTVVLIHSESADTYWGYSDLSEATDKVGESARWLEIVDLRPQPGTVTVRMWGPENKVIELSVNIKAGAIGKRIDPVYSLNLAGVSLSRSR